MICQHIVFNGWVQGVGFRYRARHAANLYGVTGWVRNDPDGSVTMEIQGTEEQIRQARSIDLLTYLQTYEPTELVHVRGDTFCTREHDSLKISASKGKWMWWSRGFGGSSALDYLIKVKGFPFIQAMQILTEERNVATRADMNYRGANKDSDRRKLHTLVTGQRMVNELWEMQQDRTKSIHSGSTVPAARSMYSRVPSICFHTRR